jgi:glutamine synthetase adenylyltransferase
LLRAEQAEKLLEHYEVLRQVEWALRRESGTGVTVLPEEPGELDVLAVWLGRTDGRALRVELGTRRAEVRRLFDEVTGAPGGKN